MSKISKKSSQFLFAGVIGGAVAGPDLASSLNGLYQVVTFLGGQNPFNNLIQEVVFFELGSRVASPIVKDLLGQIVGDVERDRQERGFRKQLAQERQIASQAQMQS